MIKFSVRPYLSGVLWIQIIFLKFLIKIDLVFIKFKINDILVPLIIRILIWYEHMNLSIVIIFENRCRHSLLIELSLFYSFKYWFYILMAILLEKFKINFINLIMFSNLSVILMTSFEILVDPYIVDLFIDQMKI